MMMFEGYLCQLATMQLIKEAEKYRATNLFHFAYQVICIDWDEDDAAKQNIARNHNFNVSNQSGSISRSGWLGLFGMGN